MHQIINQLQQLQQQITHVAQDLQGMQAQLQSITGQVQAKNQEMNAAQGQQQQAQQQHQAPSTYMPAQGVGYGGMSPSTLQSVMNADVASRQSGAGNPGRQSEYSSYGRNFQ